MRPPIPPLPPRKSQYGIDPSLVRRRVSELPGITSLLAKDLSRYPKGHAAQMSLRLKVQRPP